MNITNPTADQVSEIAARGIYLLSNLRSWQKEAEAVHRDPYKDPDISKWEARIDEWLKLLGAIEFEELKSLIYQLTVKDKI